ncbi:MAG: isoprenyl transferase [Candidatus Polarisedimenticolia bacterium]
MTTSDRADGRASDAPDEAALLEAIDLAALPRHVGVIMDGNGRWARARGLPRIAGHRAAIASVREILDVSVRLGVEVLTLYAFSRENWSRPPAEVRGLMALLREYLAKELDGIHRRNVRFRAIGALEDLEPKLRASLRAAEERTKDNTGLTFLVALSYSGRGDIVEAARALARDAAEGRLDPRTIDETALAARLSTGGLPDPDLLIRTSGELRLSNFLLWQIAYAELWVTDVLWPDFRRVHFLQAIADYQRRERRFGNVGPEGAARPAAARGPRRLDS